LKEHSFAYLQIIWAGSVGLDDVDVAASDFRGNLGLDGGLVADETEDFVVWVSRELAEELELFFVSMTSFVHEEDNIRRDHERLRKSPRKPLLLKDYRVLKVKVRLSECRMIVGRCSEV
jgi:hypothetical protein